MSVELDNKIGELGAGVKSLRDVVDQKFSEIESTGMAAGVTLQKQEDMLNDFSKKLSVVEKRMARKTSEVEEKSSIHREFKSLNGRLAGIDGRALITDVDQYQEIKATVDKWIRKGDIGLSFEERKSINGVIDPSGGYLVAPERSTNLGSRKFNDRMIADAVQNITIGSMTWEEPFDNEDYNDGVYENQIDATGSDLGNNDFHMVSISAGEQLYPKKFSRSSLEDSFVPLDSHVMGKINRGMARKDANGVVNGLGSGNDPIRGILTYPDGTTRGTIEQVESFADNIISFEDVAEVLPGAIIDGYLANASYGMRRQTFLKLLIAKDSQGKFQIGNQMQFFSSERVPVFLFGYPVLFDTGMPAVADGSLAVAFGDFEQAYRKVNRVGFSIHRDDSDAKYITLTGRSRVGGDMYDFDALKLLKIK